MILIIINNLYINIFLKGQRTVFICWRFFTFNNTIFLIQFHPNVVFYSFLLSRTVWPFNSKAKSVTYYSLVFSRLFVENGDFKTVFFRTIIVYNRLYTDNFSTYVNHILNFINIFFNSSLKNIGEQCKFSHL